jgi:hypothetical protein
MIDRLTKRETHLLLLAAIISTDSEGCGVFGGEQLEECCELLVQLHSRRRRRREQQLWRGAPACCQRERVTS